MAPHRFPPDRQTNVNRVLSMVLGKGNFEVFHLTKNGQWAQWRQAVEPGKPLIPDGSVGVFAAKRARGYTCCARPFRRRTSRDMHAEQPLTISVPTAGKHQKSPDLSNFEHFSITRATSVQKQEGESGRHEVHPFGEPMPAADRGALALPGKLNFGPLRSFLLPPCNRASDIRFPTKSRPTAQDAGQGTKVERLLLSGRGAAKGSLRLSNCVATAANATSMAVGADDGPGGNDTWEGLRTLHLDEHNQWLINATPYEAKQRGTET